MNITLTKKPKEQQPGKRDNLLAGIPPLPQVDLLPPEVRDGRRLAVRRRVLTYIVLLVVAVVLLAIAFAFLVKTNAENRLADAEERAATLAAEKRKYSEVTGVIRAINNTKEVRDFSVITEVDWAKYVDLIAGSLPDGVTIDSFEIAQAAPTVAAPQANDPVLATGLGTISFVVHSEKLPNVANWVDALNVIPGLQDAALQDASIDTESDTKKAGYTVNGSVQVNAQALTRRTFDDREVGADSNDEKAAQDAKEGQSDES